MGLQLLSKKHNFRFKILIRVMNVFGLQCYVLNLFLIDLTFRRRKIALFSEELQIVNWIKLVLKIG